jgi:hypothetical protein
LEEEGFCLLRLILWWGVVMNFMMNMKGGVGGGGISGIHFLHYSVALHIEI